MINNYAALQQYNRVENFPWLSKSPSSIASTAGSRPEQRARRLSHRITLFHRTQTAIQLSVEAFRTQSFFFVIVCQSFSDPGDYLSCTAPGPRFELFCLLGVLYDREVRALSLRNMYLCEAAACDNKQLRRE